MTPLSSQGVRGAPFPFQDGVEQDFERALESAIRRSAGSMTDLERTTRGCARELKSGGVTPEGVIITMRAYLRHIIETRHAAKQPGDLHNVMEGLCDRLAGWCLAEYFPSHDERPQSVERRP